MITTNNAVFLHIAKTAGIWVKNILEPITVSHKFHSIPVEQPELRNVFVFARNPWDWYVSFYQFHTNGSETFKQQNEICPILSMLPTLSFEEFIKNANSPTVEFKKKVFNLTKLHHLNSNDELKDVDCYIHETWISSDKGYFQHIYDLYTKYAVMVGSLENIRYDLITMLHQCKELTPELEMNIIQTVPVNVTYNKNDYRQYYTTELAKYVEHANAGIIADKGYTF